MSKSLVIVESPAKAKTINKYLGKNYVVKSSVGHIRDLPKGSSGIKVKKAPSIKNLSVKEKAKIKAKRDKLALITKMGIDPTNNWQATYEVMPNKTKVVTELKELAKSADIIYLATDMDREGEAIAWHLREIIGGDESRFRRVVFNEITKTAITEAFKKPGALNMDMVNAQQTRRFLDRVVGFMLSPLLWKKIARGLSAGRVQSVAVKLVVEKEREIKAFTPVEYWDIFANLSINQKEKLLMQVTKYQDKKFLPKTKQEVQQYLKILENSKYQIKAIENKPTKSKPKAPFITSTLQQTASTRLGYGVNKTMMLAQKLYEAGYITYMRTDSTNLSDDAIDSIREYIFDNLGKKYLPKESIKYGNKKNAQEAHEAIRPSDFIKKVGDIVNIDKNFIEDCKKLYDLIWRQAVASQITDAKYNSTKIIVQADDFELVAKGKVLKFDGWTKIQPVSKTKDEIQLPEINKSDNLELLKLEPNQHFTKPPARFNEASLVKELEKRGIGRPSTYASIISTIVDRGYVTVEKHRFYAEKIGEIVTDRLNNNFSKLMSYDFTAEMENVLDTISVGKSKWINVLDEFYENFTKKLEIAEKEENAGGMSENPPIEIDFKCPDCGRNMTIRTASTGVFLGCSGYNLPPKERCKKTINLIAGDEVVSVDDEKLETEILRAKDRCDLCDTAMDSFLIDTKHKLHICGNSPTCKGYKIEKGEFKLKGYDGPIVECEKCGSDMQLKTGRFGKYMGCTNENCKNTRKILANGEIDIAREDPVHFPELKCEKDEDAYFVLRDSAKGLFFAANTFPKHRESRAPFIFELKKYKDRIAKKFHYLTKAPAKDPNGIPSQLKYSRKTKTQYVVTLTETKKPTGWSAVFENGKWIEIDKNKK